MSPDELIPSLQAAARAQKIRESSAQNAATVLAGGADPTAPASLAELVRAGQWKEIDDRFYTTLAFGTGGLRGRTIGKVVTAAERGTPTELGRPQHPCVGTNAMNFSNVRRATTGLVRYVTRWRQQQGAPGRPRIVLAHDTRHFSRDFAELAARVAADLGCDVALFEGPRSTPELSFAVRYLHAQAGVVLTASHNPPHDNGYKVYFEDGAQIVEPHASAIIAEVNAVSADDLGGGSAHPDPSSHHRGEIVQIGAEIDSAYLERLRTVVLDHDLIAGPGGQQLRVVFTPIHGTGAIIVRPAMAALGLNCTVVPAQDEPDGRFPTVASPNPENAEALALAVARAEEEGADLVVGTDPDCDRMGVAVRDDQGGLTLLTGNQIGSLLSYYRLKTLFDQGVLQPGNASRATLVKTFVTTDLQKTIAAHFGVRCVETLTGFKYIGQKLGQYEAALPAAVRREYRQLPESETRRQRLEHATFFVFGGEESYGYSGADFVRDKDANAATLMFAEVAAYAKARGQTVTKLLDEVYAQFGFYLEKNGSFTMEGADGAAKIQRLLASYDQQPPAEVAGQKVSRVTNFAREEIHDAEGARIPSEKMLVLELADGGRVAVRGSGTEPKIKYYLFGVRRPAEGQGLAPAELAAAKVEVKERLDRSWDWLRQDAERRAEG